MTDSNRSNNGKWLVVGIVSLGVVLALIGLKYRRFPEGTKTGMPTTVSSHR
jgi:hypothetical protein